MDRQSLSAASDTVANGDEAADVERFGWPTRVAHWTLAVPFLLLLLTGLTNFWPQLKAVQVADVRLFAWLHVVLGFGTLAAIAVVILPLLLRRSARADLFELLDARRSDYLWARHHALRLVGMASSSPSVGKFNAGQKANTIISGLATVALMGTGIILGINYVTKDVFSVTFVERIFPWHTLIALLVTPVVLGHLYLALIHPGSRESQRGITRGGVRRDWAQRHHGGWLRRRGDAGPQSGSR